MYRPVIVMAWVSDEAPSQPPGSPPGIWGGGNVPMPNPPINLPPWEISGGRPPGIWGPTDPRPTPPIYWPGFPGGGGGGQQPPSDAHPEHPIYFPDRIWGGGGVPMPNPPIANVPGAPGYNPSPPGIWGGGNVPMPSPPIQLPPWLITGGQPPGIWGGGNVPMPSPPISGIPGLPGYEPPRGFPILDPDDLPEHPELPDLNRGSWVYVSEEGTLTHAFVPWTRAVGDDSYNPTFPPEEVQPGEWVMIYLVTQTHNGLAWAWIPSQPSSSQPPTDQPHPEHPIVVPEGQQA